MSDILLITGNLACMGGLLRLSLRTLYRQVWQPTGDIIYRALLGIVVIGVAFLVAWGFQLAWFTVAVAINGLAV